MPAYIQIEGVEGESGHSDHDKWITFDVMTSNVSRAIPQNAIGTQRKGGKTGFGDIRITRRIDKSSVKLAEACAKGTLYTKITIHLATQLAGKQQNMLEYVLHNAIITGHAITAQEAMAPLPHEEFTINFTKVEWLFHVLDKDTGKSSGKVSTSWDLEKATA